MVARRDSLFADDCVTAPTQGNFDVFPDGQILVPQPMPQTSAQRDRLFVVVNWPQLIESNKSNR